MIIVDSSCLVLYKSAGQITYYRSYASILVNKGILFEGQQTWTLMGPIQILRFTSHWNNRLTKINIPLLKNLVFYKIKYIDLVLGVRLTEIHNKSSENIEICKIVLNMFTLKGYSYNLLIFLRHKSDTAIKIISSIIKKKDVHWF